MSPPARPPVRRATIAAAIAAAVLAAPAGRAAPLAQPAPFAVPRDYRLVYRLDIPVASPGYHTVPVPYAVDDGAALDAGFDRVGYLLELTTGDGATSWVWASMAAFTRDVRKIGLPTAPSGAFFQRAVGAMSVRSNVPGLPVGDDVQGNLEFWPNNYATANAAGVSGARDDAYDTGDAPADPVAGYGSFQVHASATGTTLLAYNRWGLADTSDIGIGNSPTGQPDWTFRQNAAEFTTRRLSVYVREAPLPVIELAAPEPHRVVQRGPDGRGTVPIRGRAAASADRVDVRAVPIGDRGSGAAWQAAALAPGGAFSATLALGGGWYRIEARAAAGSTALGTAESGPVGVGEVFVTAGQSNSANHGAPRQAPADARVVAFGPGGWRPAADPQPIATGDGGSPWPAFGDALAAGLDVPIGLVSVGWGGTTVEQWQPGGTLYPRLRDALVALGPAGARAVLWHQGESDAAGGTSTAVYAARLQAIIRQSRLDAGYDVPWGIARVGFVPGLAQPPIDAVVAGQNAVVAAGGGRGDIFAGPTTDDLVGPAWRSDGIHFNAQGLALHGQRWAADVRAALALPAHAPEPTAGADDTPTPSATAGAIGSPTPGRASTPTSPAPPTAAATGTPAGGDDRRLFLPLALRLPSP